MSIGSMDNGNRSMLKRARAKNARFASKIFAGSERTKLAKLTTATYIESKKKRTLAGTYKVDR